MSRDGGNLDQSPGIRPRVTVATLPWALAVLACLGVALSSSPAVAEDPETLPVCGAPDATGDCQITNACDLLLVSADEIDPEAPLEPGIVGVAESSTVYLTGPPVHNCADPPTFDPPGLDGECLLTSGNGIAIEMENLTLDLNGRSIHSVENVALLAESLFGCDSENAGVAVGGKGNIVTNTSETPSVVDNFTADFDFKAEDSQLIGFKNSLDEYTVQGRIGHGGGAMAIDDSKNLLVDTVLLDDAPDPLPDPIPEPPEGGDNGIDLKQSEHITIMNSAIEGTLTGLRMRFVNHVTLTNNTYLGHGLCDIEIGPESFNVTDDVLGTLADASGNTPLGDCIGGAAEPEEPEPPAPAPGLVDCSAIPDVDRLGAELANQSTFDPSDPFTVDFPDPDEPGALIPGALGDAGWRASDRLKVVVENLNPELFPVDTLVHVTVNNGCPDTSGNTGPAVDEDVEVIAVEFDGDPDHLTHAVEFLVRGNGDVPPLSKVFGASVVVGPTAGCSPDGRSCLHWTGLLRP